jgi:LCP family protein required for cell wall assembly
VILSGYVWYTFRDINKGVTRLGVTVGQAPTGATTTPHNGSDQNILLVGNDDRSNMTDAQVKALRVGRDGGSKATDTMMIVHIPADGSRATLISLPRDSYVSIAGHGHDRLNAAYVYGYNAGSGNENQKRAAGANLLISTVRDLTGLKIDHYIQVSLLGFYDISTAIGGVPITLCNDVDDTRARNRAVGSDGGSGLKLSKGKHTIKGVQALEFVRQRHFLPHGDLDRVKRQQYFLTAAFRQVASIGILTKLHALGAAVKRNIFLDPNLDLVSLATQLEKLTANNITGKVIPTTPERIDGKEVLAVNTTRVRNFIDKLVDPQPASSSGAPTTPAAGSTRSASPTPSKSKAIDAKCVN